MEYSWLYSHNASFLLSSSFFLWRSIHPSSSQRPVLIISPLVACCGRRRRIWSSIWLRETLPLHYEDVEAGNKQAESHPFCLCEKTWRGTGWMWLNEWWKDDMYNTSTIFVGGQTTSLLLLTNRNISFASWAARGLFSGALFCCFSRFTFLAPPNFSSSWGKSSNIYLEQ